MNRSVHSAADRRAVLSVAIVLLPLAAALSSLLSGCAGKEINGPIGGSSGIPFDLTIPVDLPAADYYAIAGTKLVQQDIMVGDSIVEGSSSSLYAQFAAAGGMPVDFDVVINTSYLDRHNDGDTLRLRSASDTSLLRGDQIWHLRDTAAAIGIDLTRFTLPPVDLLDTIAPFNSLRSALSTIRSDTALTIRWQPGNGTIRIEWKTDKGNIARDAQDFTGSYTIPAEVMAQLTGEGTISVTRYRSVTHDFNGKSIYALRLSQRTYEVTVQ